MLSNKLLGSFFPLDRKSCLQFAALNALDEIILRGLRGKLLKAGLQAFQAYCDSSLKPLMIE